MTFYHYTCRHSLAKMTPDVYGVITLEPLSPGGLLWVTDLAVPERRGLGLTSQILNCDRTEYRLELLDGSSVRRWVDVRRSFRGLWDLELAPGALPMHWFVSTSPERAYAPRSPRSGRQDAHALATPGGQ